MVRFTIYTKRQADQFYKFILMQFLPIKSNYSEFFVLFIAKPFYFINTSFFANTCKALLKVIDNFITIKSLINRLEIRPVVPHLLKVQTADMQRLSSRAEKRDSALLKASLRMSNQRTSC